MSLSVGRRIAFVLFFGDEERTVSVTRPAKLFSTSSPCSGCWGRLNQICPQVQGESNSVACPFSYGRAASCIVGKRCPLQSPRHRTPQPRGVRRVLVNAPASWSAVAGALEGTPLLAPAD